jgi:hypothetical protein
MELRHLRYFVAVAEAGNLTVAAQQMLHTSQPSLSRQIRDLENEVGAQLLTRRARGIELTPAGRAFLDHARGSIFLLTLWPKFAGKAKNVEISYTRGACVVLGGTTLNICRVLVRHFPGGPNTEVSEP